MYQLGVRACVCLARSVARKYHRRIGDFEAFLPLIRALRTNGMRQRHWARLFEEVPGE
jgi:hypothetical protein